MCVNRSPPRRVDRFAWNFGNIYSSTRAIAWGTFRLPVGTSKPEVGYFAMKPTIFRYQILPWVIKKWFRVDWVTFRYSWNRKYWWKPEVFVNFNLWLHISYVTYAINISYDCRFYCCFRPFSLKFALNTHAIIFFMPITVKSFQIRGGPTFDPVKYVKEVVTWTICMPTHCWSTRISLRN